MQQIDAMARRRLVKAGFILAGAPFCPDALFRRHAGAEDPRPAKDAAIGRREIILGLDGMSRVADPGQNPFVGGHTAAAVMTSAFFCREQNLDAETRNELLGLIEARLLNRPIYAARPPEKADPLLVERLLADLDGGIARLRSSGHNIIFAVACLKALRDVPEAATPTRVDGLRKMLKSFGTGGGASDGGPPVDLSDERKFIQFVFEEFLAAIDLYLVGKGHHGFAGHVITIGHALVELSRMGHAELARKGLLAYWQFVRQARAGADLGGKRVADAPAAAPTPLERDYWFGQRGRDRGVIASSHLIKYPYSFYALAKDVRDETLKRRILDKLYHLTAIS